MKTSLYLLLGLTLLCRVGNTQQCSDSTSFSIELNNYAIRSITACNTSQFTDSLLVGQVGYFTIQGWGGHVLNEITWKVNGVTKIGPSTDFPNDLEFKYSFPSSGNYQVKCVFDFDSTCSITKTYNLEVGDLPCPQLTASLSDTSNCLFPEDTLIITINQDTSLSILNCDWQIINQYNDISYYSSSGNTFDFSPIPGLYSISAVATIQVNDSTVCTSHVNGTNCEITLRDYYYSDPFYELDGIFYAGNDIQVIYKGTNLYPDTSGTHSYSLYLNGTQQGSTQYELEYNDTIYTLTGLDTIDYTLSLYGTTPKGCIDSTFQEFKIDPNLGDPECESCNTFKPIIGEKYWISAWVREDHPSQQKTYLNGYLKLVFNGAAQTVEFHATGDIVEGWQRIVGSFIIPSSTTDMDIVLMNDNTSIDVYFDDIRIHPFNSSMKSYVYDPETLWLTAELDDNNYATFYEYDKEGQLIRIKKETARGIMTIQESRSSNPKAD